jgi:beta-glucosidase
LFCKHFLLFLGKVGITLDSEWKEPFDPTNPGDVAAAEREMQLTTGLVAHPIFHKDGDWPPVIKQLVLEKSIAQGFNTSRLPDFTQEEIDMLKGICLRFI